MVKTGDLLFSLDGPCAEGPQLAKGPGDARQGPGAAGKFGVPISRRAKDLVAQAGRHAADL